MKTWSHRFRAGAFLAVPILLAATVSTRAGNMPSKDTADYYLTNPQAYKGKEITLAVELVKPVRFQSPIPEIQFFHAGTYDERNHAQGGEILVAVPASENTAFVKKYGTQLRGGGIGLGKLRNAKATKLTGVLTEARGMRSISPALREKLMQQRTALGENQSAHHMTPVGGGGGIWLVDYEGKCADLIKAWKAEHKQDQLQLPSEAGDMQPANAPAQ